MQLLAYSGIRVYDVLGLYDMCSSVFWTMKYINLYFTSTGIYFVMFLNQSYFTLCSEHILYSTLDYLHAFCCLWKRSLITFFPLFFFSSEFQQNYKRFFSIANSEFAEWNINLWEKKLQLIIKDFYLNKRTIWRNLIWRNVVNLKNAKEITFPSKKQFGPNTNNSECPYYVGPRSESQTLGFDFSLVIKKQVKCTI